jgi:hypothetical protein
MTRRRLWFIGFVVIHAALTYTLVTLVMGWSMVILDTGGRTAPLTLQVASYAVIGLSLPLLLPLSQLAFVAGFSDPIHDLIFYPMPLLNSIVVAWLALVVWPKARARLEAWRRRR